VLAVCGHKLRDRLVVFDEHCFEPLQIGTVLVSHPVAQLHELPASQFELLDPAQQVSELCADIEVDQRLPTAE
jgi:hypothetical protein